MNYCTYAIKPQNSDRAVKLSSYMNLYRRPGVKWQKQFDDGLVFELNYGGFFISYKDSLKRVSQIVQTVIFISKYCN